MEPINNFTLGELPFGYPFRDSQRRLLRNDGQFVAIVNGDDLVLQMEWQDFSLIATSYDYFDACNHWIYLIRAGCLVDQLSMPDQIGFLQHVESSLDNRLEIGYYGTHDRWTLSIHESGFFSFKLADLRLRLNRFFLARRFISIQHTRGPDWQSPASS